MPSAAPCSRFTESTTEQTHIDTPEFLNTVEGDHFLQHIIPIFNLSAGWLGEPQSPPVHQRVLDIEVGCVVKHGELFVAGFLVVCEFDSIIGNPLLVGDIEGRGTFCCSCHCSGLYCGL